MNAPARSGPTDTVVIGGGIVGICAGLYLQRGGRKVTIVERGEPGAGASGHNGGIFAIGECVPTGTPGVIRSVPKMLRDPTSALSIRWRNVPQLAPWLGRFVLASRTSSVERISVALQNLTTPAIDAYRPLVEASAAEELIQEGGMLFTYRTEAAYTAATPIFELRSRRSVKYDILDDQALAAFDPALGGRFSHAVHMPEWRYTPDPHELGRRLAARFVADGGLIRSGEVKGFERRNGNVEAVVTAHDRIRAGSVVIAAGAWSRPLVRTLGLDVPLESERGYGVDLPDPGITLRVPIIMADEHVALRHKGNAIRLSGVDELASVSAPPRLALADRLVAAATRVFPELRTDGADPWMHCRPSMPDSLPVIGRLPRWQNAYAAFGHGHKGLCLAAITGKLVAELVHGQEPSIELTPYRPTRFSHRRRGASG